MGRDGKSLSSRLLNVGAGQSDGPVLRTVPNSARCGGPEEAVGFEAGPFQLELARPGESITTAAQPLEEFEARGC